MKAQAATAITPELCAQAVMETVPLVMRFIRMEMRSRRAPSTGCCLPSIASPEHRCGRCTNARRHRRASPG